LQVAAIHLLQRPETPMPGKRMRPHMLTGMAHK
jgi:hypothetical protein